MAKGKMGIGTRQSMATVLAAGLAVGGAAAVKGCDSSNPSLRDGQMAAHPVKWPRDYQEFVIARDQLYERRRAAGQLDLTWDLLTHEQQAAVDWSINQAESLGWPKENRDQARKEILADGPAVVASIQTSYRDGKKSRQKESLPARGR